MLEAKKKLIDAINETMEVAVKESTNVQFIKELNEKDLKMMKTTLNLIGATVEYIDKSTYVLNSIDSKTDKILSILEKLPL